MTLRPKVIEHNNIINEAFSKNESKIYEVADRITQAFKDGPNLMLCGNGGSAADAQHIAAEFVGRFMKEREALPAIALTTDSSILTAIGNDYGYEKVFARQVEAYANVGAILIGLSTSGNSRNVIEAFKVAKKYDMLSVSLTGHNGGELKELSDININVPSNKTPRIQEAHIFIGHTICELVEEAIVNG